MDVDRNTVRWQVSRYENLTRLDLYRILAARSAVFVVEQNCPYQDLDGLDDQAIHLWAQAPDDKLLAYARLLPPDTRFAEPSIGRVLTAADGRGQGLGRLLMIRALEETAKAFPGLTIRISAQQYLEKFYQGLGFETASEPYLEDDIPHLEMLRAAPGDQGSN